MGRVALDADVVTAFLDPSYAQHQRAVELIEAHLARGDDVLIAATVFAEVIVRPLQHGTDGKVDEFLTVIGADIVDVDRALARRAAELRARHGSLRLPDALSLATALARGSEFLTLDPCSASPSRNRARSAARRLSTRTRSGRDPAVPGAATARAWRLLGGRARRLPTDLSGTSAKASLRWVTVEPGLFAG